MAAGASRRCRAGASRGRLRLSARVSAAQAGAVATPPRTVPELKRELLLLGAQTERGQLLFTQKAYAPLDEYGASRVARVRNTIAQLVGSQASQPVDRALVDGRWELVLATKQLFRSSPFFMAIQDAFGDAESFNQKSSELFFRLHELQVKSWGASTIGKVEQQISLEDGVMESFFDTILFALTVIPIIGWFKLLPTFGGRILTVADKLKFDAETGALSMEVQTTRVDPAPGVPVIPIGAGLLMGREYPVNSVWRLLPWNKRPPTATTYFKYVDEDFRITEDRDGEYFVYVRVSDEDTF